MPADPAAWGEPTGGPARPELDPAGSKDGGPGARESSGLRFPNSRLEIPKVFIDWV